MDYSQKQFQRASHSSSCRQLTPQGWFQHVNLCYVAKQVGGLCYVAKQVGGLIKQVGSWMISYFQVINIDLWAVCASFLSRACLYWWKQWCSFPGLDQRVSLVCWFSHSSGSRFLSNSKVIVIVCNIYVWPSALLVLLLMDAMTINLWGSEIISLTPGPMRGEPCALKTWRSVAGVVDEYISGVMVRCNFR